MMRRWGMVLAVLLMSMSAASATDVRIIGGRPHGCPSMWCGCFASLHIFGRIIPTLNLAYNWVRSFNPAEPAPGMAAARSGHVFVLERHVVGDQWVVLDGNTWSHATRGRSLAIEHIRSIRGFRIVDPHSPRGTIELAARLHRSHPAHWHRSRHLERHHHARRQHVKRRSGK